MNSFGNRLRLTTFGESHGPAMGGIIDGFPAGFKINFEELQNIIDERKPGTDKFVSQRKEADIPEFLSGINDEGITLGTPIGFIVRNTDIRSEDYKEVKEVFRPNHADYTYFKKYGVREFRGGGRASARETLSWVVAGALAIQWLKAQNIQIDAKITSVGDCTLTGQVIENLCKHPVSDPFSDIDAAFYNSVELEIKKAVETGDSLGGVVTCVIKGLPASIGNPVADKLHSALAAAMMSINAAKGFDYGLGTESAFRKGSEVLDEFYNLNGEIKTKTNFSGGIQGGISNGMPIFFNVYFKPTPTLSQPINTINTSNEETTLRMKGRHDPCVALRAVPVVKCLAALVIADFLI